MNLYLERIRKLYEGYLKTAEELEKNRKIGDGLFGLGHGPEDDPCHERLEKALELAFGTKMVKGANLRDGELGRTQEMVHVFQLRCVDCGEDGLARHLAEALVKKSARHL